MKLTRKDYRKLLTYYKINIPKNISFKKIKKLGEKVLAKKLCTCIKKLNKNNNQIDENRSIAICRNAIFNTKNLNFNKFTCKKGYNLNNLKKTKKNIFKIN